MHVGAQRGRAFLPPFLCLPPSVGGDTILEVIIPITTCLVWRKGSQYEMGRMVKRTAQASLRVWNCSMQTPGRLL